MSCHPSVYMWLPNKCRMVSEFTTWQFARVTGAILVMVRLVWWNSFYIINIEVRLWPCTNLKRAIIVYLIYNSIYLKNTMKVFSITNLWGQYGATVSIIIVSQTCDKWTQVKSYTGFILYSFIKYSLTWQSQLIMIWC